MRHEDGEWVTGNPALVAEKVAEVSGALIADWKMIVSACVVVALVAFLAHAGIEPLWDPRVWGTPPRRRKKPRRRRRIDWGLVAARAAVLVGAWICVMAFILWTSCQFWIYETMEAGLCR